MKKQILFFILPSNYLQFHHAHIFLPLRLICIYKFFFKIYIFLNFWWVEDSPTKLGLSPTLLDLGWAECSLAQVQRRSKTVRCTVHLLGATVQRTPVHVTYFMCTVASDRPRRELQRRIPTGR